MWYRFSYTKSKNATLARDLKAWRGMMRFQVGDWTEGGRVIGVDEVGPYIAKGGAGEMRPVRLTGEILSRNGWRLSGGYWVYRQGRVRLGWSEKNGELVIGYALLPLEVRWVHEMQRVLEVAGGEDIMEV